MKKTLQLISSLFKKAKIKFWLFGGYALDAAVGKITREHKNIDFLIERDDVGKAVSILEDNGFRISFIKDKIISTKEDEVINLIPIELEGSQYVIPVLTAEIKIPLKYMDSEGSLEGLVLPRIPNELLYLLMRYSPIVSDSLIVRNLKINKKILKSIKIKRKPLAI